MKLTRMRPARWAVSAAIALALLLGLVALANGRRPAANRGASAFMWLRPESRPRGWNAAVTRSGAALAYPPGWREIRTDPGTASAAPADARRVFSGYLNATPQSGDETLANWSRFRVAHVAAEALVVCTSRLPRRGFTSARLAGPV